MYIHKLVSKSHQEFNARTSLRQGKYNRVPRALPYPNSEAACRWRRTFTPSGRVILEPIK